MMIKNELETVVDKNSFFDNLSDYLINTKAKTWCCFLKKGFFLADRL